MIGIRKTQSVLAAALLGLFCLGCSATDVPPSANGIVMIERDAGVITEDLLGYDFLIGGTEIKEIAFISADCGCTQVFLNQGDIFDYSQPFRVIVQLQGTRFGKGHQDFFVKFSDDTAFTCRLAYEYAPLPFASPKELLFFEDVRTQEIILCFPNETDVAIYEVIHPTGITWKRESEQEKKSEIRLVFEIDRTLFEGDPMGIVEVFTTSQKRTQFSLPYLVLRP